MTATPLCENMFFKRSSSITNIRNALTDEARGIQGLNKIRKLVIMSRRGGGVVGKTIGRALGDQALEREDGLNDHVVASELRLGGQALEEDHTLVQEGKQM